MQRRERVNNTLTNIENFIWSVQLFYEKMRRTERWKLLKKNEELRNKYEGETCFVIGNGPSLKLEKRLGELKNYKVFSVNQFYRSEWFDVVQPDFHVMVDPLFFNLSDQNETHRDTLERMRKIALQEKTQMILPADAYGFIKENLGNVENHYYIKERYAVSEAYKKKYDMAGYLPASCNVVLTAIYCAIYMGFKRIVILGCDMTGLLDNYIKRSPNKEIEKFSHVYSYTEEEKKRMQDVHKMHTNEFMLHGFYKMFRDFRVLKIKCNELGIDLTNATQETALDCIPFSVLDNILNEKR